MRILYLAIFSVALYLFSCKGKNETVTSSYSAEELKYTVSEAPEWTALFKRHSGWFGGDGIFAIPYSGIEGQDNQSGDSILFVFSDTMVGEIKDNQLQPGYKMVNNSVAILKGEEPEEKQARFLVAAGKDGNPVSVFTPETPNAKPGEYYWLGDGFVNHALDSNMYIFAYRIVNTNTGDAFPFREVGNAIIVIPRRSKFPFENHRQLDVPFFSGNDSLYSSLGAGVLVNTSAAGSPDADGYVYVYGVRGPAKELIASRIRPENFEDFSSWEFWNGAGWTANMSNAAAIADSVSNELSVVPLPGHQYALIYQYGGIMPVIYMQVGPGPAGPFGPRKKVWDIKIEENDLDLFSYNAKGHPAISKPGELLVSYNVNSFKFFDAIERDPNLYRPRFLRIVFEEK